MRDDDRATKLKVLREFCSRITKLDLEGKSIGRIYLGKDLIWDKKNTQGGAKVST